MEISEITIRNFKGIEEIKMGPIKPINVLIGRNNSGKSSVLTCIHLLNKYFLDLDTGDINRANPTIKITNEYFKKDTGEDGYFEVSITVTQNKDERNTQFNKLVEEWNQRHTRPQMGFEKITSQLDRELFGSLTFDFRAGCKGKHFGLIMIRTHEKHEGKYESVEVAQTQNPGGSLSGLSLMNLFMRGNSFNNLSELAGNKRLNEGIEIRVSRGQLIGVGPRNELCGVWLLNPTFEHIKKTFQTAFMVSPYRHGRIVMTAQRCKVLSENGENIVNYLHDLHLNNYEAFQKVETFVKGITPEAGRLHPRFIETQGSELELAYEWPDGRVVNLTNMGGGVEQLLILGCVLIQQKTSCVLWEEPESHLHPAAQEILLNKLEEYVSDSAIFITTHSPVFIRSSDKVAVNIITNKDGKSGKGRTLSSHELQEAASVLGSRPGHLSMADIVIYVEGKSGAAVIEKWIEKWPDREKVLGHLLLAIQPCNPDEIGTKDFDLAPLMKVTPNMIMFVDKDNDAGTSEPKQSRKDLQEKCKALGIPCIITEKRQIEDYFTEDAVRQGLPSNILSGWKYEASKPMNEQLPTKKYNAKIAAAMKWEDVAKHKDIMKVFEEIENFAKNLKPETNG